MIIYHGRKVPDWLIEKHGSIHLGKGIWLFNCELKKREEQ